MVVFVVWFSYLYKLGTLSWWPLKQRNCWKLKLDCLKAHNCNRTVTAHMIFPFCRNSWQTQCCNVPNYLGCMDLYSMKSKLGPLPSSAFFLLYPFKTDVNVIIWNTPCHLNVIILHLTSPHDAPVMSCSLWWEFMCMHLVSWVDTLTQSMDTEADTLIHPSWSGKLIPGAYHDTLPQIPWHALTLSQPGYNLLKTYQKYNWQMECTMINQSGWLKHLKPEYKNHIWNQSTSNYL